MKISHMTNDQAIDAMVRISEPIAHLLEDKSILPILNIVQHAEGKKLSETIGSLLPKAAAFAMKDHKSDLYEIVGALAMRPTDEVGKMNFMETVGILKESIDEDFIAFFRQSGDAISKPGVN